MTGKTHTIGTRAQVWHGTAKKTSGGLMKNDLMMNKAGRIVSRAKHNTAKKEMRLVKYGYGTKKGKFGFVKIGTKSRRSKKGSKKMRGGMSDLHPSGVETSYMIKDVVPQNFGPLERALVGGRRRHRKMRGGMGALNPADINATDVTGVVGNGTTIGLTSYPGADSNSVQLEAGQAGGRRRHRKMSGGTLSRAHNLGPGSTSVQMQAGLGN